MVSRSSITTEAGQKPNKLKPVPKIKLLDPFRRLAPCPVPELPSGKFTRCEGQMAFDFDSDDPGALVDPP
jgi:hypothetical protein